MTSPRFETMTIVGICGGVGTLFARALSARGITVSGIDLRGPGTAPGRLVRSDARQVSSEARELLGAADGVLMALPEDAALAAAEPISRAMRPEALLVDTLSVKGPICAVLQALGQPGERLSIHPMARPSLGLDGSSIAVIEISQGPAGRRFLELLQESGARLERMTAEQHDRATAAVQVATHAALLTFGLVLDELDYDVRTAWPLATPLHRVLLALLARILEADPSIYWEIQSSHPRGDAVRRMLREQAARFERMVSGGDPEDFSATLRRIREVVGSLLPELIKDCDTVFRLLRNHASR